MYGRSEVQFQLGAQIVSCPVLVAFVDHIISHFFTKLKIYHLSLFIKKVLLGKQEITS